jgi:hypothetical protein
MSTLSPAFAPAVERAQPLLPRWLREEWLFWLAFASWTVLPSTRTPIWTIGSIPVKSTDALLIPFCVLYLLPRLVAPCSKHRRGWHMGMPLALLAITAFGALSTAWSGSSAREAEAMRYTMAMTASSGLLAYCVITSVSQVREFLWRLAAALSAVSLLYTAQSLLGLGLRSAAAVTLNDFGMERVRGPLFESSTGYFLLIPALAFVLQETLARRIRLLYGVASVFALSLAILGLGSRAGYALFGLFAFSGVWMVKGRQKMFAIAIIAVVAGLGAALIFSKANADRLQMQSRDGRTLMHETVASILSARTIPELLSGSGLGSLWPWYLTEAEGGDLYTTGRFIRRTPHGILLYHPHSTVLLLGVELGLAGVLFLAVFGVTLVRALRRAFASGENVMFAWGLAVSFFSIEFDLFLVRRPTRDAVWWILLFGLLALLAQQAKQRRAEPA